MRYLAVQFVCYPESHGILLRSGGSEKAGDDGPESSSEKRLRQAVLASNKAPKTKVTLDLAVGERKWGRQMEEAGSRRSGWITEYGIFLASFIFIVIIIIIMVLRCKEHCGPVLPGKLLKRTSKFTFVIYISLGGQGPYGSAERFKQSLKKAVG